jgi:hypothetical protein
MAIIAQSILWGLAMTLSALTSLWFSTGWQTSHLSQIIVLVLFSSIAAYPLARFALYILDRKKRFETQFAGSFFCLTIATIGLTAAAYSLNYWSFYAQWHGPTFSRIWVWQFFFTNLGALYQFAVMGLKFYLPVGIVFLTLASWLIARDKLPQKRSA